MGSEENHSWNLAQVNIARMRAPLDDPIMTDFVNNLDRINALAEQSEGFVWRLVDDTNNATSIKILNDDFLIVNMSVWKSMDDLFNFTYKTAHIEIFKRKKDWFTKLSDAHLACWYVPKSYVPSIADAEDRLTYMNLYGITPYSFTFKKSFSIQESLHFKPQTSNPKPQSPIKK